MIKIFFACDIHGSMTCFGKFLNALRIYKVDVGILLGDLSGKMINPIVKQPDGSCTCNFLGEDIVVRTEEELGHLKKRISLTGNYYFVANPDDIKQLMAEGKTIMGRIDEKTRKIHLGKGKVDELFMRLTLERLKEWIKLAEERLKDSGIQMFMAPGNDDLFEANEIIDSSSYVVNADGRKVYVDDHEMVTLSWANPTPWDTPRECPEDKLAEKIGELVSKIDNMETAIFNFHVPPYGTALDEGPALKEDLTPIQGTSANVGSKAVFEAVRKHQPLLGLHGHIHESRGMQKIGRTICVNPGSEYTEGILRGVIITLDKGKFKNSLFTSG